MTSCLQVGNLKYLSGKTDLPLVQLLGGWPGYVTPDNNKTHAEMTSDESLEEIAMYASGVGPWKETIRPVNAKGYADASTGLVQKIQSKGLQVLFGLPIFALHPKRSVDHAAPTCNCCMLNIWMYPNLC
jgi:glycerophosphoryl diester phosphodiesterase